MSATARIFIGHAVVLTWIVLIAGSAVGAAVLWK